MPCKKTSMPVGIITDTRDPDRKVLAIHDRVGPRESSRRPWAWQARLRVCIHRRDPWNLGCQEAASRMIRQVWSGSWTQRKPRSWYELWSAASNYSRNARFGNYINWQKSSPYFDICILFCLSSVQVAVERELCSWLVRCQTAYVVFIPKVLFIFPGVCVAHGTLSEHIP